MQTLISLFWISFGILWAIVALQSFVLLEVLGQVGQIRTQLVTRERVVDLERLAGHELEELEAVAADTLQPVSWEDYLPEGRGVVLMFTSRCVTCRSLARRMTRLVRKLHQSDVAVFAILSSTLEDAKEFIADTKIDQTLLAIDSEHSLAQSLDLEVAPCALAVDHRRILDVRVVSELKHVDALARQFMEDEASEITILSSETTRA
jgi:peroxiredoxin